jgi:hypothetical protein
MSTNAELNTGNNRNLLLRMDKKVIAIIQSVIFIVSLNYIIYLQFFVSGQVGRYGIEYVLHIFTSSLIASPLAVFLGTVLLIKGIQLIYGSTPGEIQYKKLRTVLFVISLIIIILFAGCVLYFFVVHGSDHFSYYLTGRVQILERDSLKYIVTERIYFVIGNFKVIIGFFTGILFMTKSA